jgi:hypothetical protein
VLFRLLANGNAGRRGTASGGLVGDGDAFAQRLDVAGPGVLKRPPEDRPVSPVSPARSSGSAGSKAAEARTVVLALDLGRMDIAIDVRP